MGDISAEPSMEEILSSIKRIIAEEGDGGQSRARRQQRPTASMSQPVVADDDGEDDVVAATGLADPAPSPASPQPTARGSSEPVLELSNPMPDPDSSRRMASAEHATRRPAKPAAAEAEGESILSQETAAASRGSLQTLSKLLVKPEQGSDGTLEGMVREMLRPMLREWLDSNLPDLVETLVAREIEKITGQPS